MTSIWKNKQTKKTWGLSSESAKITDNEMPYQWVKYVRMILSGYHCNTDIDVTYVKIVCLVEQHCNARIKVLVIRC